jgi:hypothetical protein
MLKLLAMLTTGKIIFSLAFLLANLLHPAAAEVFIQSPVEGDTLQGAVTISGGMDVKGFVSYEAAFAYDDGKDSPTWFLIRRDINQVQKGTLAVWDTTTITDGDYQVRILAHTDDGREITATAGHLHVSNYSPIKGGRIAGGLTAAAPALQKGPSSDAPRPVEMKLPPNPAELSREQLNSSLSRGLILAAVLLGGLGLYLAARRVLHRK